MNNMQRNLPKAQERQRIRFHEISANAETPSGSNSQQINDLDQLESKYKTKNLRRESALQMIRIEIPTVKLQKNRGRILSTDEDFGTNQDRQIWKLLEV
jgi:hypothetical protein